MNRVGLTLIELLLVLAMMACAAALVLPNLIGQVGPAAQLRTQAAQLADQLRSTRQAAIDSAETWCISFPAGSRLYWQFPQNAPNSRREHMLPPGFSLHGHSSIPTTELTNILFRPDGSATAAHIEVRTGNSGLRLTIERLTGQVVLGELP